eukprot:6476801-Amphidinium_carterae.1
MLTAQFRQMPSLDFRLGLLCLRCSLVLSRFAHRQGTIPFVRPGRRICALRVAQPAARIYTYVGRALTAGWRCWLGKVAYRCSLKRVRKPAKQRQSESDDRAIGGVRTGKNIDSVGHGCPAIAGVADEVRTAVVLVGQGRPDFAGEADVDLPSSLLEGTVGPEHVVSSPLQADVRARSLGFSEDEVGDEIARARRAVTRGQGGPVQRTLLPVDSFDKLWDAPLPDGGVLDVRYVKVVATWWLLREIEAAALRVRDVHLNEHLQVATLNLAASKTDIEAKGALRSHGCSCSGGASSPRVL